MAFDLPQSTRTFADRHIGPSTTDQKAMLASFGYDTLETFISDVVPTSILNREPLGIGFPVSEFEAINALKKLAAQNKCFTSYIGTGYVNCITPPVIQRNILENPGWYTAYTPYQAEIAQGRLEALINFQTMVSDLTALPIANASLLDEATAAAEAMSLCFQATKHESNRFFVSDKSHPQVIDVIKTRANPIGIEVIVDSTDTLTPTSHYFGVLLPYPTSDGEIIDYRPLIEKCHAAKTMVVMSADLLSLAILTPPGELGADVVIGSTQRFGVPMGYGGPHAAFMATKDEFKRLMPGRIIGISIDAKGKPAYRLALQTREQHIRRAKATSNICTAQVLLAVIASMYAVYHGPKGIKGIADRIHALATRLATKLNQMGMTIAHSNYFDTIRVTLTTDTAAKVIQKALSHQINFRQFDDGNIGITIDETTTPENIDTIVACFSCPHTQALINTEIKGTANAIPPGLRRQTSYLTQDIFNRYHSETEMLRYIRRLEAKDLSLTTSMIPLGSCTMKLNATTEMLPITWPEFANIHPFVPLDQAAGYQSLISNFEKMLCRITAFDAVSLQPNAGSQGELTGLLVIREYHRARGDLHRTLCLIPNSAHGTNPASAVMAGMQVVGIECDDAGNINLTHLKEQAEKHRDTLAALMVTYPSTHGVFEEDIRQICEIIHANGGQVYMDGANMNAQVGLCRPAEFGADVCHLNLHKTFSIPHGGGGPGMGPIGVKSHLAPYLPSHPVMRCGGEKGIGAVSAAPWGSAVILTISYLYSQMMGDSGLKAATEIAILNANYIAKRLAPFYPVLFKGRKGLVAHECIIDMHPITDNSGVSVEDVAKRLMDYGFHAPTMSWPIAGTLMIEPTESESKEELDRFCEAMVLIYHEAKAVAEGKMDRENNPLKNAPHTARAIAAAEWNHSYSREEAAFPAAWLLEHKYWPPVSRINNPHGDRNLICTCQSGSE